VLALKKLAKEETIIEMTGEGLGYGAVDFKEEEIDKQLKMLQATGDQFSAEDRKAHLLQLPSVWTAKGNTSKPVLYDTRILSLTPSVIAPSAQAYRALEAIRPQQTTTQDATAFIDLQLNGEGVILGFSGYGTGGGYKYKEEYEGIDGIFSRCKVAGISIDGVIDGATGYGVPGLSGALAKQHGHSSTGFVPFNNLHYAAPRDTLVVIGEKFGDEASALGAIPDLLVAFGGEQNAEKEIRTAMSMGSMVVLAALRKYPENSAAYLLSRSQTAKTAHQAGKLVVCNNIDELKTLFDDLDIARLHKNREKRRTHLYKVLEPEQFS
jgi:hypothetical protein